MTALRQKIDNGLDEARILVLGTEVLVGMSFRTIIRREFEDLSPMQQRLEIAGLAMLIATFAFLLLPASFHRLVEEGNDTDRLHRFIGAAMAAALVLFAAALGLDVGVAAGRTLGRAAGVAAGAAAGGSALVCWWGIETIARRARPDRTKERDAMADRKRTHETDVDERVRNVLTEARLILPGAQALLGFQLAAALSKEFTDLPGEAQGAHLASLGAVCLATIFLMTPSAYHRLVERGENSARFDRIAARWVVAAMVPLALGISGDFFVVLRRVHARASTAVAGAAASAALFALVWFAFPLLFRRLRGGFEDYRKAETRG